MSSRASQATQDYIDLILSRSKYFPEEDRIKQVVAGMMGGGRICHNYGGVFQGFDRLT